MSHKKVIAPHPALTKQYRPADAVRKRGDDWRMGREVWNVSPATFNALKDTTPDWADYIAMTLMERGTIGRCQ